MQYAFHSKIFKWSGNSFVKLQSLQTYGALDEESLNINGNVFLVFANFNSGSSYNTDSFIYKWDGGKFVPFQPIPTRGASTWHPLRMCGQTFLGVANYREDSQGHNTKSVIYRYSGEQLITYQEISTKGAKGMTSSEYNGRTYLVVANSNDNYLKYHINSTLYKWIQNKLGIHQSFWQMNFASVITTNIVTKLKAQMLLLLNTKTELTTTKLFQDW